MRDQSASSEAHAATELIARIGKGDAAAETELVARYSRGLLFLLRRKTGSSPMSDDLYQETFRVVLEKARAGKIDQPEKLAAFIRSTASNLHLGALRKSKRSPVDEREPVEEPTSTEPSPLSSILREETVAMVRRLVAELKHPRDREILYRYYLTEEDKDRIRVDLELDSLHFNRVLYKARQRFKELYAKSIKREKGMKL